MSATLSRRSLATSVMLGLRHDEILAHAADGVGGQHQAR